MNHQHSHIYSFSIIGNPIYKQPIVKYTNSKEIKNTNINVKFRETFILFKKI